MAGFLSTYLLLVLWHFSKCGLHSPCEHDSPLVGCGKMASRWDEDVLHCCLHLQDPLHWSQQPLHFQRNEHKANSSQPLGELPSWAPLGFIELWDSCLWKPRPCLSRLRWLLKLGQSSHSEHGQVEGKYHPSNLYTAALILGTWGNGWLWFLLSQALVVVFPTANQLGRLWSSLLSHILG